MDNRMGEVQVFLRVVDTGSFSEAARQTRTTPSTVSKLIARIESRLGVRLIERSTRRLSLTEEGRLFYERGRAMVEAFDSFERELTMGASSTGGTVRVSTSVGIGVHGLEPLLPEFWKEYPNIVIDLSLSDEVVDLYLDRTDVALRVGPLADSTLTARRIGAVKRRIVGTPDYFAHHGVPTSLEDLSRHNCLGFNFRRAGPIWPVGDRGRVADRQIAGTLLANNGETVRRMVLAGVGIARLGDIHLRDDLATGRLVEVMPDFGDGDLDEIHALYLGGKLVPHRIRLFLDFIVPRLQARLAA
ncbi:LysR family transcriptional regulator [Devosia sp.]|uniref:LysR family transcriptional regulator n=1 Tax=Devosia sp. TaxID=1871048 RepID=UPI001AC497E4|nr:LysR family transcriptional regulator [Devosia sp.]MBN9335921.1 LysR family transcriptional regulator [Devosia sp.]